MTTSSTLGSIDKMDNYKRKYWTSGCFIMAKHSLKFRENVVTKTVELRGEDPSKRTLLLHYQLLRFLTIMLVSLFEGQYYQSSAIDYFSRI